MTREVRVRMGSSFILHEVPPFKFHLRFGRSKRRTNRGDEKDEPRSSYQQLRELINKGTYNVGDIVIDGGGSFFRVTEANGRLDLSTEPILSVQNWGANALSGVIPIDVSREVSESVLVRKNDRLILSPTINGVDIIANSVTEEDLKASENVSPNAVQRVIGGVPMQYNGYNIVPMSSFISFDLDGLPTYLTIYYNKSLGTWGD